MKHRSLYLATLILFVFLNSIAIIVSGEEDRHTPGFPQVVEGASIPLSTPINISDIEKAISELYNRSLLNRKNAEKLKNFGNLSFKEAVSRIDNTDVRNNLLNLYNKNELTPEDIETFLNYLDTLKVSGTLNPIDELLALKALETLSNIIQSPYTSEIILRMFSAIKDLEITKKSISISEKFTPNQQISIEKPSLRFPSPSLSLIQLPTLPRLKLSLPNIPQEVFISIGITTSIAIALLISRKYLKLAFDRLKINLAVKKTIQQISDTFLEAYWRSVHLVSSITGLSRNNWETHREFLEKVFSKLDPRVAEVFKDITFAYEEYRYGFRLSSGQKILEGSKKLMSYAKIYK